MDNQYRSTGAKLRITVALLAGLGTLAPLAANAAPFFTPHAQLVQEINQSYGTQFKVPGQHLTAAQGGQRVTVAQGMQHKG